MTDFSQSTEFLFNKIVQESKDLTDAEKKRIIEEGIMDAPTPADIFYPFESNAPFEGEFLGDAPDFIQDDKPIKVYKFKDSTGKTWLMPKYKQLRETDKSGAFPGFDKQTPGTHLFRIIYEGEHQNPDGSILYQFTVQRKLK